MKKRYIIFNTLIVISSLIIFLLISTIIVENVNQRNMENEIKSYLSIVEYEYDGNNMKECADNIHNSNNDIRVTFISDEGVVLYDTSEMSEEDHLTRPEIQNLGTVTHRYSDTVEIKMFYVATHIVSYDTPLYIRVSMPEASITDMTNALLWYGFASIVAISIISAFVISRMTKSATQPLRNEINRLGYVVGDVPQYEGDDLLKLSHQIDRTRDLIEEKIYYINEEKQKTEYIIENISHGLAIIDGKGQVILANKRVLEILEKTKEDMLNKNYLYVSLDKRISDTIERCQKENISENIDYSSNNREYVIYISTMDAASLKDKDNYGVAMFIYDVTDKKKVQKMKMDFFANASHELKSPLTTIIGYQQMIEKGIITEPEEISQATAKTVKEATRMNQIITEMLELSKLESQAKEEKGSYSIAQAVDEILFSFEVLLKNKNITVHKDYDDFSIKVSKNDLYHLLRNLIDNAIKYNKENGQIDIIIDAKTETFCIKDTGIGIAKENLDRIYERFYRVDKAKSKESGGTGLGLAIVKHICQNNNYQITCQSTINEGSQFTVQF